MSMTDSSARYFAENAARWDDLRTGYFNDSVRDAAIAKAHLHPDMVAVDVGTGTGFLAAGLAPRVQKVYAFDASPDMLAVARQKLQGFENIVFEQAAAHSLPLPDRSVDAVFANMVLHHIPEPLDALREMVRVLRPGGRLVITDMDAHPYSWLKEEMADVWQGFERQQIQDWLAQAGLVNRIVDCTGQDCCAESSQADLDTKERQAQISVFVSVGTKRVEGVTPVVSAHYAAHAESQSSCCGPSLADSSCCSPAVSASSCCGSTENGQVLKDEPAVQLGYVAEELLTVPQEAASMTLGCGNPTAMAELKPGETVVDIGSGGGLDSFLAAQKVGPTGRVIGVDPTPAMLTRARQSARRNGYHQVQFRRGTAEALPVIDGTVDVVLSNCVINLTPDKGKAFAEIFRVLKDGGRLEVSDVVTDISTLPALRENPENWSGCLYGALPEQEYLDLIQQAGFQQVTIRKRVAAGEDQGVKVFSITVSARKMASQTGCGCSPSCCG